MIGGMRIAHRAWLVWGFGALSFSYAFFQRVAPSVMVVDLMREFAVGAAILGNLSAIYLYAYAGLQIPIGLALDRWGPRLMLSVAAVIAAAGSALFAVSEGIGTAYIGRLLVGTGCAVGFVGALKLATHWFPSNRFAFVSGLTMFVAMMGAIAGQAPLAALVGDVGWRVAMLGAAVFAAVLAAATWLFVRDRPPDDKRPDQAARNVISLSRSLAHVLAGRQNWIIALYGGAMTAPFLSYAGLWGVTHQMQLYGLDRVAAAGSNSLMLVGWAVGAPAGGWISDRMGRRRIPMTAAAALSLVGWIILLYTPNLSLALDRILLFGIGSASGAMVVCIAAARERASASVSGATTGFINMAMVGAGAVLQPGIGYLLDVNWDGAMHNGARLYSLDAFDAALVTLPSCAIVAIVASLLIPAKKQKTHQV
jgi:MFS family permease